MDRREFLRLAGAAAATPMLGSLLAACGGDGTTTEASPSGSAAGSGGASRKVRLGFIALTDCASIVMAKSWATSPSVTST